MPQEAETSFSGKQTTSGISRTGAAHGPAAVAPDHPRMDIPGAGAVPDREALDFLPARKSSLGFRKSKGVFHLTLRNTKPKPPRENPASPAARLRPASGSWGYLSSAGGRARSSLIVRDLDFAQTNPGNKSFLGGSFYPGRFVHSLKTSGTASRLCFQPQVTFSWAGTGFGLLLLALPSYQLQQTDFTESPAVGLCLAVWLQRALNTDVSLGKRERIEKLQEHTQTPWDWHLSPT